MCGCCPVWEGDDCAVSILAAVTGRPSHGSPLLSRRPRSVHWVRRPELLSEPCRLRSMTDALSCWRSRAGFNAYRTTYYGTQRPTPQQAQELAARIAAGGFHPNPARSMIVGVIGPWRSPGASGRCCTAVTTRPWHRPHLWPRPRSAPRPSRSVTRSGTASDRRSATGPHPPVRVTTATQHLEAWFARCRRRSRCPRRRPTSRSIRSSWS